MIEHAIIEATSFLLAALGAWTVALGIVRRAKGRHASTPFVKWCWRCRKVKAFAAFPASRRAKDGCQRTCYVCQRR